MGISFINAECSSRFCGSKRGMFCLLEFDLRRFLCTESEQLIWKSEGLPSDDLSIENALVILQVNCVVFNLLL